MPLEDGGATTHTGTWKARYALGGQAIVDEYEAVDTDGQVVVSGINVRSCDSATGRWVMYWFDRLSGDAVRLGPPELGGVTIGDGSIRFQFHLGSNLMRARFEDISTVRFTWHGDVSNDDGRSWQTDTIIVEARRVDSPAGPVRT